MVASKLSIYCALKFSMKKQGTSTQKPLLFLIRICNIYSRKCTAMPRAADPKNRNYITFEGFFLSPRRLSTIYASFDPLRYYKIINPQEQDTRKHNKDTLDCNFENSRDQET
jgi:hypothetical protein